VRRPRLAERGGGARRAGRARDGGGLQAGDHVHCGGSARARRAAAWAWRRALQKACASCRAGGHFLDTVNRA
ncbi:unnamed protein product, partial [Heterosigma akashiwo]